MILSIIVAASENNVIGKNNTLPWHMPADMKFFKEKTTGHVILTGRKNYESIPEKFRPLPNRTNIVITRQKNYQAPGAVVFPSIEKALEHISEKHGNEEVFIIGGAEIFKQTISACDKIYLTRIHHFMEGDVFFPVLSENDWRLVHSELHKGDEKNKYDFTFQTWERRIPIT
jgi:dihydrofolate reductase